MIPFYFFRRRAISPVASLYHSELMDKVDYWGKVDRLAVLDEIRHYADMLALDMMLTFFMADCLAVAIGLLICAVLGFPANYECNIFEVMFWFIMLVGLGTWFGARHLTGQYAEALEFSGGGNV